MIHQYIIHIVCSTPTYMTEAGTSKTNMTLFLKNTQLNENCSEDIFASENRDFELGHTATKRLKLSTLTTESSNIGEPSQQIMDLREPDSPIAGLGETSSSLVDLDESSPLIVGFVDSDDFTALQSKPAQTNFEQNTEAKTKNNQESPNFKDVEVSNKISTSSPIPSGMHTLPEKQEKLDLKVYRLRDEKSGNIKFFVAKKSLLIQDPQINFNKKKVLFSEVSTVLNPLNHTPLTTSISGIKLESLSKNLESESQTIKYLQATSSGIESSKVRCNSCGFMYIPSELHNCSCLKLSSTIKENFSKFVCKIKRPPLSFVQKLMMVPPEITSRGKPPQQEIVTPNDPPTCSPSIVKSQQHDSNLGNLEHIFLKNEMVNDEISVTDSSKSSLQKPDTLMTLNTNLEDHSEVKNEFLGEESSIYDVFAEDKQPVKVGCGLIKLKTEEPSNIARELVLLPFSSTGDFEETRRNNGMIDIDPLNCSSFVNTF